MYVVLQEYCSNECVVGECKDVYNTWTSCMLNNKGPNNSPDLPATANSDLLVK